MLKAQKKGKEGPCCRTECVAQLTRQETEEIQEETMNENEVLDIEKKLPKLWKAQKGEDPNMTEENLY